MFSVFHRFRFERTTHIASCEKLAVGREGKADYFPTVVIENATICIGRKTGQVNFLVLQYLIGFREGRQGWGLRYRSPIRRMQ